MPAPVTLVVGATGQLGSAIVRKLRSCGHTVRAFVREDSRADHLKKHGAELWTGDLRDPVSIARACDGAQFVVSTANAAMPRKAGDTFRAVDLEGHYSLIEAARGARVERFVYISVCSLPGETAVPLFRVKREVEQRLQSSGVPFTILRAAPFMDLAFAMMGSDLPLHGEEAHSAERPFWFSRKFFESIRRDLDRGHLGVTGTGLTKHSFICVNDVAEFAVRSLESDRARNEIVEIGGPETISQCDVAALYSRILGAELRVKPTPAIVFRLMRALFRPFSEAASNIAAINLCNATEDGIVPGATEAAERFGVRLTTAEEFLRSKAEQYNTTH